MEKMDVRVKKTYSQLIDAFLNLLKTKSFDNISVSEICEEADVHRATFYKHFNDKYEFLNFCLDSLLDNVEIDHLIIKPSPENVRTCCFEFVKVIFNFIDKYRYVFRSVFSSKQSITFNAQLDTMITNFCVDKMQSVLKNVPSYKVHMLANFYSGAVIGVAKWYVNCDEEFPIEDIYCFFEHRIQEISIYYQENMSPYL